MSAPEHMFIFYSSFSLRLTENFSKQKHFLKTLSTYHFFIHISFFCKMYNKEKLFTAVWSPWHGPPYIFLLFFIKMEKVQEHDLYLNLVLHHFDLQKKIL